MYNTNRGTGTIAALVLGILFTISPAVGGTTLLDENFDSYADGAWPTGFYQFGYDYDYYGGNDVVSGVIPACPSSPKCFMTTNPFSGWGNDISVPFSWSPSSYDRLIWSAAVMLPLNASVDDDAKLELIISPFDRQRICGFGLQEVGSDQINIVYNSSTGMQILGTGYHNDQWIRLRGELNIHTATYDVYVNDILLGDDLSILPGRTVSEIGAVFLGKGFWESNSAYYDDVLVLGESIPLDIHDITISEVEYRQDGVPGATPYEFYCFVRGDDITSVTITTPGGVVYDLEPWPTSQYDWELCLDDLTLAEIQTSFPRGPTANYILTFNGGSDSVSLIHNPTVPGGFANITYPAHNSYNIPLNPTITWDPCIGYGDVLNTALYEELSDRMVDMQWRIPIETTSWTVGPLNPGLLHWLEVSVYTGTTPSAESTAGSDAFDYYNIYENCNEVDFITIPRLSGWVWMDGSSDFGYSFDEEDLVYFVSFWPVSYYNLTTGLWGEERPMGSVYVNWPFLYESDTGHTWFALPPENGLWVYHFSTNEWTVLPRIIP